MRKDKSLSSGAASSFLHPHHGLHQEIFFKSKTSEQHVCELLEL